MMIVMKMVMVEVTKTRMIRETMTKMTKMMKMTKMVKMAKMTKIAKMTKMKEMTEMAKMKKMMSTSRERPLLGPVSEPTILQDISSGSNTCVNIVTASYYHGAILSGHHVMSYYQL